MTVDLRLSSSFGITKLCISCSQEMLKVSGEHKKFENGTKSYSLSERNCFRKPAQLGLNTLYVYIWDFFPCIFLYVFLSVDIVLKTVLEHVELRYTKLRTRFEHHRRSDWRPGHGHLVRDSRHRWLFLLIVFINLLATTQNSNHAYYTFPLLFSSLLHSIHRSYPT